MPARESTWREAKWIWLHVPDILFINKSDWDKFVDWTGGEEGDSIDSYCYSFQFKNLKINSNPSWDSPSNIPVTKIRQVPILENSKIFCKLTLDKLLKIKIVGEKTVNNLSGGQEISYKGEFSIWW